MTFDEEKAQLIEESKRFADSAFPVTVEFQYESRPGIVYRATSKGFSKRELFAAMAMQGFISNGYGDPQNIADKACQCADALIEKL